MLKKCARYIVRFRVPIIILAILLTILFGYFIKNVKVSANIISLVPEDNRELIILKNVLKKFGSSTFVIVSVKSDDVYSLSTLTKIKDISDEIQKLPEIAEVVDPFNAPVFKYLFGMLVVKKSLTGGEVPSIKKLEEFKNELLSEPVLKNVVVSENGKSLAIYIRLKDDHNTEPIREKLLNIIEPYRGPEEFHLAGRPIIESWVKEYLVRDSIWLVFPIIILVIAVLFINFKSIRGIVLPLTIMVCSIIWTLGLMGMFNREITMVGVMLPTLILVISSSYSIHFLNQYHKDIYQDEHRTRNIEKSIVKIGKTIILAALTTIAGFSALIINKIKPMRELGIFVLIGVFFAMVLSLTFLPGILTLLREPRKKLYAAKEGSRTSRLFSRLGNLIIRRWRLILLIALAIGIWSCVGIRNISVDTDWKRFFKKNSEILTSQRFIRSNYGGVSTFNVVFEINKSNDNLHFRTLDTLRYVDQIEEWIRLKELFGPTVSLVDYIKRANQLMNKNDPKRYALPQNDVELLKILLMFKMSNFTESLGNIITEDFKNAKIIVRTARVDQPDPSLSEIRNFIKEFKAYIHESPFEGISVEMSGVDTIYVSLVDYLVRSQLLSIAISIVIVFFIITCTLRSFVYGFFGLIPIAFGLLLNFGAMSYFRIPLDFITSMIASIAVGLGVDNSIHYLIWFSRTKHSLPLEDRIRTALVNSGIPIFFTSFTLIAGFSMLLTSTFKPILYFGLLISVTMLGCLIGVLFVLPALIWFIKPQAIIEGKEQ